MDIKIKSETQNFKFRANSIIVNNDKVLLLDLNNNGFLCLPGGHVHIGEDSKTAVIRETQEEVGIKFKSAKLVSIIENFFTKKKNGIVKDFHELSFYYLMENGIIPPEKQVDFAYIENDEGKLVDLKFYWIGLNKLDEYDIRPAPLKEILKDKSNKFKHFLVK